MLTGEEKQCVLYKNKIIKGGKAIVRKTRHCKSKCKEKNHVIPIWLLKYQMLVSEPQEQLESTLRT